MIYGTVYVHLTCEMRHMTCGELGWWPFSHNFCSKALTIWEWRCLRRIFTKDQRVTEFLNDLMNGKDVCRAAPATLGLFKSLGSGKRRKPSIRSSLVSNSFIKFCKFNGQSIKLSILHYWKLRLWLQKAIHILVLQIGFM